MRYWINYLGVITTALALSFPTFEGLVQGEKLQISPVFAQNLSYGSSNSEPEIIRLLKEGEKHYQNEEYEQALEKFQQALKLRRDIGDLLAEGRALFYVGATYEKLGKGEKAFDYYWEVIAVAEEMADQENSTKTNSMLCKTPKGREKLEEEQIQIECYLERDSGSVTLLFDEDDK